MIISSLTTILLLSGWSVGASPTSSAPSSAAEQQTAAPQTQDTVGNQPLAGLFTGATDTNLQSPSPSPAGNEAAGTESFAEQTAAPSPAPAASGNSNPLEQSAPGILGGVSSNLNVGQQAAQTAAAAADQTSQSPASTPAAPGSGNPLGDLSGYLNGAGGLLSPSLLPDLEEVIHDAAYLLRDPTTKNTKTLLGSAFDLINPDSVDKIKSAIHQAEGILTPEAIDELKKVNLVEIFDDIGYLWTKGKSLLGSMKGLVSEQVIKDIEAIIESIKNFLTEGSTKDLEDIVNKLEGLLPPEVTNSLKTLISSIGPFIDKAKPIFSRIGNYMSHMDYNRLGDVASNAGDLISALAMVVTPENIKMTENAIDRAKPYFGKVENYLSHVNWDKVGGLMSSVEALISAMASALTPENIKKIEQVAEDAKPYIEKVLDYLAHANWDRLGQMVSNMEDLIGTIAGFVTPQRIQEGKDAFNRVKGYFSQDTMNKARALGSSLWSNLSPGAINRASDLMGNAEVLLGAAAPLVTPESLDRGKHMYSEAKSYFPPDFMDRLHQASNKLGILYDSIAPGITTPTMDKLGGLVDTVISLLTPKFANETSSLIGTASGVLTPHLVNEVEDFVQYVEKMFTPDVRNETKAAIGSAAHVRFSPPTLLTASLTS